MKRRMVMAMGLKMEMRIDEFLTDEIVLIDR